MKQGKLDTVKEIIWTLLLYALYYVYCFIVLMLFHLIFYSVLNLDWTIKTILILAFAGSTVMIGVRIFKKVTERKHILH